MANFNFYCEGHENPPEKTYKALKEEYTGLLIKYLKKKGVEERDLSYGVERVIQEFMNSLGRFRGHSKGECIVYLNRICGTVAETYRKGYKQTQGRLLYPLYSIDDQTRIILREEIQKAFDRIPHTQKKEAFALHGLYGMTYKEISIELTCTERQVERWIEQVRKQLCVSIILHSLSVDIHLVPSSPHPGESTQLSLILSNSHSKDALGVEVSINIGDISIGSAIVDIPGNSYIEVEGFSWIQRADHRVLCITLTNGGEYTQKTFGVPMQ